MALKKWIPLLGAVVAVVLGLSILAVHLGTDRTPETPPETAQGISYLRTLEAKNPADVDTRLKELHLQELKDMRDERLRKMESGEISVWSLFDDYVIMGDSRAAGYKFLQVLEERRILAEYGDTTRAIATHYEDLEQLNPAYIFLCYGLNDMVQTGCETPEAFAQVYKERLEDLQTHFPEAKIFVNPIFPCTDPAFERWEKWRETEPYTEALREMVQETTCYYVPNDNITDFQQYWQEDGIHFALPFYTIWSENMIMAMYDCELGLAESGGTDSSEPESIVES